MTKFSELLGASLSDIHLCHKRTPTKHIVRNLRSAFPNDRETKELDLIFIVGDVFDTEVAAHQDDWFETKLWVNGLLRLAKDNDITVVVLEGTPSHDWKQSRLFVAENEDSHIGADLHYVETLSILHLERFGLNVLCVPDEWRPETDDTWSEVRQLLSAQNLTQVDFTLLHGAFDYQLPSHVKVPVHIPERYAEITKYYVCVGHVHIPSQRLNILNNGSFDRISHGEEHDKGHWRFRIDAAGKKEAQFRVNKNAMIYHTFDVTSEDLEETLLRLEDVMKYPKGSHMRVMAMSGNPVLAAMDLVRKRYPDYQWSSKVVDRSEDNQPTLLVDMRKSFEQIPITDSNISELVLGWIANRQVDPAVLEHCRAKLEELRA